MYGALRLSLRNLTNACAGTLSAAVAAPVLNHRASTTKH